MTEEELEKEAEKWLRKYLLCCNCEKKCNCIDSNSYCEEQVLKSYLAGAEPREKRIAELETRCNELFLQTMQLTKAKEIISKLANLDGAINIPMDKVISLRVKAEQFIKDSEVEK